MARMSGNDEISSRDFGDILQIEQLGFRFKSKVSYDTSGLGFYPMIIIGYG